MIRVSTMCLRGCERVLAIVPGVFVAGALEAHSTIYLTARLISYR